MFDLDGSCSVSMDSANLDKPCQKVSKERDKVILNTNLFKQKLVVITSNNLTIFK